MHRHETGSVTGNGSEVRREVWARMGRRCRAGQSVCRLFSAGGSSLQVERFVVPRQETEGQLYRSFVHTVVQSLNAYIKKIFRIYEI